jgi:HSP20 family molecular chaperone IbpA
MTKKGAIGVVEHLGRSAATTVLERVGRTASRFQEARPLRPDLLEHDDAYLAVFDAPGAESSNVQVRFEDGRIVVRIDRFRKHYEDFEMRYPGRGLSLDGHVRLPRDAAVDPEAATASLRSNGTLAVRIPKVEAGSVEGTHPIESDDQTNTPA